MPSYDPDQKEYVFECAVDEKNQVTGIVVYGEATLADRVWELYWIAVDPRRKGLGIGRRLMDHFEGGLRAAGARMILVETSGRPDYAGTNEFYVRCGYREAARIRDYYREGDDIVVRLYECAGHGGEATLTLDWSPTSAQAVDLLGQPVDVPVQVRGKQVRIALQPWQIATLKLGRG